MAGAKTGGPVSRQCPFSVSEVKSLAEAHAETSMQTSRRSTWTAGLSVLSLLAGIASAGNGNQLTIRVANGPYAGSYQSVATATICMHAAAQDVFSSAWKDFGAAGKALAEAGVEVSSPDASGPKRGTVRISFGKDGKAAVYELVNQALTFTPTAKGASISADGKTKDGIGIHLEALCSEVDRL